MWRSIRPIRYSDRGRSVIVVTDRTDWLFLLLCAGVLRPGLEADLSPVSSAWLRMRDVIFALLNMHFSINSLSVLLTLPFLGLATLETPVRFLDFQFGICTGGTLSPSV